MFTIDSKSIDARLQAATLIDLVIDRGGDIHHLLKGTSIFYEDILSGRCRISLQQYIQLIRNASKLINSPELSFLLGARLYPGNHALLHQALINAPDLETGIALLLKYWQLLSPGLVPKVFYDDRHCYLYWLCLVNDEKVKRFLIEANFSGLTSMIRWLAGKKLPWQFVVSYREALHLEQYHVHLNRNVRFNGCMDLMVISQEHLVSLWPRASATTFQLSKQQLEQVVLVEKDNDLINEVYDFLWRSLPQRKNLALTADYLAMSPATLKRRLKNYHYTFQQLLDEVLIHKALYFFYAERLSNEEVAQRLNFHDVNNFRRSFKRWTGLTPSSFRQLWI